VLSGEPDGLLTIPPQQLSLTRRDPLLPSATGAEQRLYPRS